MYFNNMGEKTTVLIKISFPICDNNPNVYSAFLLIIYTITYN